MNITRCLTISADHITPETASALDNGDEVGVVYYAKDGYGWWVYTEVISENDLPDDLAKCLEVAIANECELLCLDCDGEVLDELPVYEW